MPRDSLDPCPRCGKVRQAQNRGRITQWISTCICDLSEQQSYSAKLCPSCGKHIESGRAGSLTQWIFRSDLCSCSRPDTGEFVTQTSDESDVSSLYKPTLHIDPDAEPLDLDPEVFPSHRYKAYKQIGQGAAGAVYLCFDTMLAKEVAVKVLHQLTPEQLVAFQSEARITSSLNHPHIIKVLDFGATIAGAPFMVMEYFPGQSLETLLHPEHTLDVRFVIEIFVQTLDALMHAHQSGLFHRDIKPSNILFRQTIESREEPDPRASVDVRVIDFGVAVAKLSCQEPTIIQGMILAGTPAYMSPDQISGHPYSQASEIYSIGCVLLESLTGQPPFDGETAMEILSKHASTKPPVLRELLPHSKWIDDLSGIIEKCLEKDPMDRFASVDDVKEALLAVELDDSTLTDESNVGGRRRSSATTGRKLSKQAVLAIVILILLVVPSLTISLLPSFQKNNPGKQRSEKSFDNLRSKRTSLFRFSREIFFDRRQIEHFTALDSSNLTDADFASLDDPDLSTINLDLSGSSKVTGKGLKFLQPAKVRFLDLSGTGLAAEGCNVLSKFTSLECLNLDDTNISDENLRSLFVLNNLKDLHLSGCKNLTDRGLVDVSKLHNLKTLGLERTNITDAGCAMLKPLRLLTSLSLDDVAISDVGVAYFVSLPTIYHLRLGRSHNITSKSLKAITQAHPELQLLSICFTSIKPEDLGYLENCPNLTHLEIFGVPLGDKQIEVLSRLTNMEQLYVSQLNCTDQSLKRLYALQKLRILNFTNCDNVSEEAINALKANLPPECNICWANKSQSNVMPPGVQDSMNMFLDSEK